MPVHRQRSDPRASGDESSTSIGSSILPNPANSANQHTTQSAIPYKTIGQLDSQEQALLQPPQQPKQDYMPSPQSALTGSASATTIAAAAAGGGGGPPLPDKPTTDVHGESVKPSHSSNQRRPYVPKFPTMHGDKFPEGLRPELPSHFDRNLTVEKARFDPQPLSQAMASDAPRYDPPSPPHQDMHQHHSPPLHSTPKTITPSASSTGLHTPAASTFSSTVSTAPPIPPKKPQKSKSESDRHVRSNPPQPHPSQKKSKRRPPPVNGAATPAEVFHRNLVDAVSNAEDSDENEHYVYSYGGADHPHNHHHQHPHHVPYYNDTTYTHPRQNSIQSHASSASAKRNPLSTNFLTDLFRSSSRRQPESLVDDEETARSHRHRPKLRNYVMDYRPKQQFNASTTWDNHRWYNKRDEPPPIHSLPTTPAALPTRRQRIYPGAYTDGYSSDDEGAPLMMRRSARSRRTDPKRSWPRMLRNVVLGMFIAVLFGILFLFYRATPLTDISVDMGRVLASDKELIFDLRVRARNPNWWTVRVAQADISMFAFSQVVPFSDRDDDPLHQGVDPAEFLGSFFRFDEPLSFAPAFMNGPVMASSQIRIKRPGADTSGNERWARIIRYPYGLVARGVLKYHPFPLSQLYPQSAVICDVARVDPHSGTISDDPDQSYCLKDGKLITR